MPAPSITSRLIEAAAALRAAAGRLSFKPAVACVYNPLDYAWAAHETYLRKFANRRKPIVFLGMNPGPFGMVQTGVPFGEVSAVRDWMSIETPIRKPRHEHPKRPIEAVATMTEGVFVAGCMQGPKDIPASVVQGAAAAARVLGRIQQKEIALEPVRASINEAQCSGCRICNNLCPFNAILFHEDRMVSEVNAALCQGCGTCVAACPAGAISGTVFSNDQILSQIEGLLMVNLGSSLAPAKVAVPA